MATERNVVDFKIHNLTEEQFQELKEQGKIDPNALYCTPDETVVKFEELRERIDAANEQINTKQDIATAVNYDNITNCITEIPQDIKLELADGVLTLKAGSKYYRLGGSSGEIDSDYVFSNTWGSAATGMVFIGQPGGQYQFYPLERTHSGTQFPTGLTGNSHIFFNTSDNLVYFTKNAGTDWVSSELVSLPLAIVTWGADNKISSIDQVFNGFGYIGSTVFAFPGVKGLVPNGRNEDGTLKNVSSTTQKVIVTTKTADGNYDLVLENNFLSAGINTYSYDKQNNINTWYGNKTLSCYIGSAVMSGGKFVSLTTKTAFHAVDYNDFEILSDTVEILSETVETLSETVETNNDNAVHKTGNETIAGVKTFSSTPILNSATASTVPVLSSTKQIVSSAVTATELSYLSGVTSAIQTQLNNKANASANNFTAAGKGAIVNLTMPNYGAGVAFTLNKSTPYTAPKDGFVFIYTGRANDQYSNIKIGGTQVGYSISNWSTIQYFFPVAKGTVVSTDYDTIGSARFYPLKGAI